MINKRWKKILRQKQESSTHAADGIVAGGAIREVSALVLRKFLRITNTASYKQHCVLFIEIAIYSLSGFIPRGLRRIMDWHAELVSATIL